MTNIDRGIEKLNEIKIREIRRRGDCNWPEENIVITIRDMREILEAMREETSCQHRFERCGTAYKSQIFKCSKCGIAEYRPLIEELCQSASVNKIPRMEDIEFIIHEWIYERGRDSKYLAKKIHNLLEGKK